MRRGQALCPPRRPVRAATLSTWANVFSQRTDPGTTLGCGANHAGVIMKGSTVAQRPGIRQNDSHPEATAQHVVRVPPQELAVVGRTVERGLFIERHLQYQARGGCYG